MLQERKFWEGDWIAYKEGKIIILKQPDFMDEFPKFVQELQQLYNFLLDETGYPRNPYVINLSDQ